MSNDNAKQINRPQAEAPDEIQASTPVADPSEIDSDVEGDTPLQDVSAEAIRADDFDEDFEADDADADAEVDSETEGGDDSAQTDGDASDDETDDEADDDDEPEADPSAAGDDPIDPTRDPFLIELEEFNGPLDLLLHLIKKHEMDIFDIPIALITEKYLRYVEVIRQLNLERAGDFLVMAATLAHIKSKMLLPPSEDDEDEEEDETDPREELVRRLLQYQKYKEAAESLATRPILGRDVFARPPEKIAAANSEDVDIEDVSVFQLIEVFQELLDNAKKHAPHQVQLDTVSVDLKVSEVIRLLRNRRRITFRSLFANIYSRPELVATFLAVLELARLSALRIYQTSDKGEIYMSYREDAPSDEEITRRVNAQKKEETDEQAQPGEDTESA